MANKRTMRTTGRNDELCTEIAETVAEAADVDPLELDPLYDVVDPEVIEELLKTPSVAEESSITFTYTGHQVTVEGEGVILVEELPEHT